MFIGAQVSLYPMTDGFVDVILEGVAAMKHAHPELRLETDDISTLIVGPPEALFEGMRALFVGAAKTGQHVVLSAHVSRGCPGEPDDPACATPSLQGELAPLEERVADAVKAVKSAPDLGAPTRAQLSIHPLGTAHHMDEIAGAISFLRQSGVFDRPKNFCTKIAGDAGPVFAALHEAFVRFGQPQGHAVMTFTASANSPTEA